MLTSRTLSSFLLLLLCNGARADDALDKKVFLMKRAIKHGDCDQARDLSAKLLSEFPKEPGAQLARGLTNADCLNMPALAWANFQEFLRIGGDLSAIESKLSEVEAKISRVNLTINAPGFDADILGEKGFGLSLPRDAASVQDEPSKFRVAFMPSELNLSIVHQSPILNQKRTVEGTPGSFEDLVVDIEAAQLTFGDLDPQIKMKLRTPHLKVVNVSPSTAALPSIQTSSGEAEWRAHVGDPKNLTTLKISVPAGTSALPLPYGIAMYKDESLLVQQLFAPNKTGAEKIMMPIPGTKGSETFAVDFVAKIPGKFSRLDVEPGKILALDAFDEWKGVQMKERLFLGGAALSGVGAVAAIVLRAKAAAASRAEADKAVALRGADKRAAFNGFSDAANANAKIANQMMGAALGAAVVSGGLSYLWYQIHPESASARARFEAERIVPYVH